MLEREDSLNHHLHPNKKWRRAAYYSTEASCCLRVGCHMTKYDFISHNVDRRELSFPQLTHSFILVLSQVLMNSSALTIRKLFPSSQLFRVIRVT